MVVAVADAEPVAGGMAVSIACAGMKKRQSAVEITDCVL
jgi:hypothetical protein